MVREKETTGRRCEKAKQLTAKKRLGSGLCIYCTGIIGLRIFYIWPFFQNFWFSFNDVNKFNMATFVGLENYKNLAKEPELGRALWNTVKYALITTPIGLFLICSNSSTFERRYQRKIFLPYNLFPSFCNNGSSCSIGMEMDF